MEYKLSSFKFNDQISRDDKHYAIMRLNQLRPVCPYDARFSGEFKKNGTAIEAKIRIHFSRGEFRSSVKSSSMEKVMDSLSEEVREQIEYWRGARFSQEETFVEFYKKVK